MRLFSRIGDMLDANISQLLERAKQPSATARKMVNELEDTMAEIKLAASEILHDKAQLVSKLARFRHHEKEWQEKAMLALEKDREDLARDALEQKLIGKHRAEAVEKQLAALQSTIDRYQEDILRLEEKLRQAQRRRQELKVPAQGPEKGNRTGRSDAGKRPKRKPVSGDSRTESPWIQLENVTRFSKDLVKDPLQKGKTK